MAQAYCAPFPRSRRSREILTAVAAALLGACSEDAAVESPTTAPEKYVTPFEAPARGPEAPEVAFTDVSAESGIDFTHCSGAFGEKYLPETMGSGVVVFDHDEDGLQDLFLVQSCAWKGRETEPRPTMKLYRSLGGLRFEDVTDQTGLGVTAYGMGACAADYDGDGDRDLFVTCLGPNLLFRNDGGRFSEVAGAAGLTGPTWTDDQGKEQGSWSTGAAWLDYDGDQWLDLFVCNYVRWSVESDLPTTLQGLGKAYTRPNEYEGDSCRLYRNVGDGTFTDVSKETGIYNESAKALGVAVEDLNQDGRPDIVVSNDTQPNYLFLSQPDGTFREAGLDAGIAYDERGQARAGMGVDVADYASKPTIAIGNFSGEPVSLFEMTAEALFLDRAAAAGISRGTLPTLTFGLRFFDYDLDGAVDLMICNGHIEPEINTVQNNVTYAQPLQLFWNQGNGRFLDAGERSGSIFQRPIVGRGLAVADLDRDGDSDCVVTCNAGRPLLLRNDLRSTNHWLRVQLAGKAPNRDALGAVVELTAGGRTRRCMVRTGSSYLSQSELALTFGLGAVDRVDSLRVTWPSGQVETFDVPGVDRVLLLEQGGT